MKDYVPSDIEIIELKLYSKNKSYSLRGQCKTIDIYESILSNTIYAQFRIVDGISLLSEFPIIGEEWIKFSFKTPEQKQTDFTFYVNKISNKTINDTLKTQAYTLTCVNKEILTNASSQLNKTYDKEISASITEILKNDLKTTKAITAEDTRGIDKIVFTNQNAFKCIDMMRHRAVSKKYISSSFVFFENQNGFNFSTLEKLFTDGAKSIGNKIFYLDTNTNYSMKNVTFRNIIAYKQVAFTDTVTKIQNGSFSNIVNKFDLISGDISSITYTNNEAQDKFKFADKKPKGLNTSGFESEYGKTTTISYLVPFDSSKNESFIPEKISILQSFVQKIVQNLIQIYFYGDNTITVGQVITCNLPKVSGLTDEKKAQKLDSGNYLVSKLRHMITLSDRPNYTQSAELIKGNFIDN